MALFQNSCQNLALVGWCFGGESVGGGCRFGAGGGGGRWVGVAVRLVCCLWCVDVLLCILTKCFSELVCFAFSSRLFSLLSSPARWVLPASLLASLASSRFLSVWFALHRRAAVFGPVFWSVFPHRGNVFLQSKKVRWSFALFLDFHFCAFLFGCAFLFACAFFWSGLLCTAQHRFSERPLGPNSHFVGVFCKANNWSSWSGKKVLNNLSIFELKNSLYSVST